MRHFESHEALKTALDLAPLMPGAFRFAKQFGPASFTCARCGEPKPLNTGDTCATGYGISSHHMVNRGHVVRAGQMVCFECAGETDRLDMIADGRATLYLTGATGKSVGAQSYGDAFISNWPGTLRFHVYPSAIKRGRHNIAGTRYDAWFTGPDGKPWHGVQYGDNTQIVHCRRVKK